MPFLALGVCSSNFTAMNGQTQWGIPHSLVHELTHDGPGKDIQMCTCPLLPPGNSYPSTVEWGLFSEELVRVPGDGSLLAKFGRKFHRIYAFRGILFPDCADALFEVVKFMALRKVNTSFHYSFFFLEAIGPRLESQISLFISRYLQSKLEMVTWSQRLSSSLLVPHSCCLWIPFIAMVQLHSLEYFCNLLTALCIGGLREMGAESME